MLTRKYFLLSNATILELRNLLNEVECVVKKMSIKKYHMLLSEEIEQLVDDVALNIIKRPENTTLLRVAQNELNGRIGYAISHQAPTEYNLQVCSAIGVNENISYLILCGTESVIAKLTPELKKIGLQAIDKPLSSDEVNLIMERVLFPVGAILPDMAMLKFHDAARRGMRSARHNLMNRLLRAASQGREVQNYQLMYYMDLVMEELNKKEHINEVKRMGNELSRLLPEITEELITK